MLTPIRDQNRPVAKPDLPVQQPDPNRIAVLLNKNARKVTNRLVKRIERIIGREHTFYSHNLDEAEAFAREIVQRGYGTVLSGGGDGTLVRTVHLIQRYIDESNAWRLERYRRYGERQPLLAAPRFGFLRLGTGNGISQVVGAKNPLADLRNIVDFAPGRTYSVPLIESDGDRFFFGGMGYDSMLLNDYTNLKNRSKNRVLKAVLHGLPGYFAALFFKTIPRILFRDTKIRSSIVNHGEAYYIDPRRGDAAIEIEPGATLFEGDARMIAAGTSPFFGYGFRMFPFARIRPGFMHLRVTTIDPFSVLMHLPSAWRGSYRNPTGLFDFLVKDFTIDLDQPYPFQHSGDAQGLRKSVRMQIAPEPLRLVDCYSPRLR